MVKNPSSKTTFKTNKKLLYVSMGIVLTVIIITSSVLLFKRNKHHQPTQESVQTLSYPEITKTASAQAATSPQTKKHFKISFDSEGTWSIEDEQNKAVDFVPVLNSQRISFSTLAGNYIYNGKNLAKGKRDFSLFFDGRYISGIWEVTENNAKTEFKVTKDGNLITFSELSQIKQLELEFLIKGIQGATKQSLITLIFNTTSEQDVISVDITDNYLQIKPTSKDLKYKAKFSTNDSSGLTTTSETEFLIKPAAAFKKIEPLN